MCVCAHVWEARGQHQVSSSAVVYLHWSKVSLLPSTHQVYQAGWPASPRYLLSSQCWDSKHIPPCPDFSHAFWRSNSVLRVCVANLVSWLRVVVFPYWKQVVEDHLTKKNMEGTKGTECFWLPTYNSIMAIGCSAKDSSWWCPYLLLWSKVTQSPLSPSCLHGEDDSIMRGGVSWWLWAQEN